MDMVREALGEDAIIVATREEKDRAGNPLVHLTAAVDKDVRKPVQSDDAPDASWMYNDDDDESGIVEYITDVMLHHAVPEEVLDQVISSVSMMDSAQPHLALTNAIDYIFRFAPLSINPEATPFMMVGPPGAGKTLAVAKMAARSAMAGLNVAVITTDVERAGGREQLEAFTRLMDIELRTADNLTELKEVLLSVKNADQVIIDTAGTNPFDKQSVKQLAELIGTVDLCPMLVIPANTNAEEAGEMAEIFAAVGAQRLIATRVDVARRLGGVLSAAHQGALAFADISATAQVGDGLSQLNAKRLTQLLMPRAQTAKIQQIRKTG